MACENPATYRVLIDWDDDQVVTGGDDVTQDVLRRKTLTNQYGRDQQRTLSPMAAGTLDFDLCNVDARYSPENPASPFYEKLQPGRLVHVDATFLSTTYPLSTAYIDDFDVSALRSDQSVTIRCLDALARLQQQELSTPLYRGIQSGTAVGLILDAVDWPSDARDIDQGASTFPYWWEEGTNAFDALNRVVNSEGPPAIAYMAPDGTFVFRSRHHRLLRPLSLTSQATFAQNGTVDCESPAVTGFEYTEPFEYDNGIRDIVNSVTYPIDQRFADGLYTDIYQSEDSLFSVGNGETKVVKVVAQDPFIGALKPVAGTDYTLVSGTPQITISRTSGQSLAVFITGVGGAATIRGLKVRAQTFTSVGQIQIEAEDSSSVAAKGRRSYTEDAPFVSANDAIDIAEVILGLYSDRVPKIRLRVVNCDDAHLEQILERTISDKITIRNVGLGLDAEFFIERVEHDIRALGKVHAAVFGCQRTSSQPSGLFILDESELDVGVLGEFGVDDPERIFIFDHPTQGQFDVGLLAR